MYEYERMKVNLWSKEERMVDALALKDDEGREKLR